MPKFLRLGVVRKVQLTALQNGGSLRTFLADGAPSRTVEWDISGRCTNPVRVELHARAERKRKEKSIVVTSTENRPAFVEMETRCRKCDNCLRYRATLWRYRAMSEYRSASRTWLGTLTLNPEQYARQLSVTRHRLAQGRVDYDGLPEPERFKEFDRDVFREIQLMLKRWRKNTGAKPRYLAVTEAHKSGLPHWHLLIHEDGTPLRYDETLKGSWKLGFHSYKLVKDAQAAGYVTKYLSKALLARVRASQGYGAEQSDMPPKAEVNEVNVTK